MSGAPATRGRGLSLMSGGLDSTLAVVVLREQGCTVEAVAFDSPFFKIEPARAAAARLGVVLHVIDFTADIVSLVKDPPHGFGGCMNPCIDCHARMIRRVGDLMNERGFDFVATGEVLNQRPMSQTRTALATVARESGYGERLVRPLSARRLEPTLPEQQGLIDRARLLDLQGRSRRPQMELAVQYGITVYPTPAGGCLLTEAGFCRKLQDLQQHEGIDDPGDLRLLRLGRHFRLPGGGRCVVGRDADENAALERLARPSQSLFSCVERPGPTLLLAGTLGPDDLRHAAELCAAYADTAGHATVQVAIRRGATASVREIAPPARETFRSWLL